MRARPKTRKGAAGTAPDLKPNVTSDTKDSARRYQSQARWKAENPQACWAHQCLRSAIKRGLVTPEPCEVCGTEPADGHHDDYDRPMDVRWLCRRHHRAEHRGGGE